MKMRYSLSVALLLVLVLTLSVGSIASAQGNLTWSSAFQVANLEATDATVVINYYSQSGSSTNPEYSGSITIPGNGSTTIFPFVSGDGVSNGPATFNGSVVISSDKEVAAILNTQTSSSPFYGASTNGFSQGATSLSLPLIACNNAGFNTWFNIQNTSSSAAANVTVNYAAGSSGTSSSDTATIQPNRAKTFDQASTSTSGTKACGSGLGDKFVGGATVTSDQPVVASVMFLGTGSIQAVQGYNGFTGGSTSVNLPLIMSNNSTFYTAMQIQNAGSNATDVTITYGANTGGSGAPTAETYSIPAGGSQTVINLGGTSAFSQNDWNSIGKFVGSAQITQSGSEPLVTIVNQNSTSFTSLGSSYEGFDPSSATNKVSIPLVAANNSGFLTGVQIQALNANTSVTVAYSENSVQAGETPVSDTFTLGANESKTLIQNGPAGTLAGVNNWDSIGQYIGSAIVTADGPIIAIVNFTGSAALGDASFTYNGFNIQ